MRHERLTVLICALLFPLTGFAPGVFADDVPKDVPRDPWVVVRNCVKGAKKLDDYTCTLELQERLLGKLRGVQTIASRFRRTPFSVYMKWTAGPYKGREALYVDGANDGMMFVYLGDWPRFRRVVRIRPDSAEIKSCARHPITVAGVHYLVRRMHEQYTRAAAAGTLRSRVDRTEKLDGRLTIRLVRELEDGGRRVWNVDAKIWVPVRVACWDKKGKLIECYWYRDLKPNARLDDEAFDPGEIW